MGDGRSPTTPGEPDERDLAAFARYRGIAPDTPHARLVADFEMASAMGFAPRLSRCDLPEVPSDPVGRLNTLRDVARALGRDHRTDAEVQEEIQDALTDYADWDVHLQDDGDPSELVVRIRTTGTALRYPVTIADIYRAVDDLVRIADGQAEQELDENE